MKCNECRYFTVRNYNVGTSTYANRGVCRRYAPRPSMNTDATIWPTVEGHMEACGDSKAQPLSEDIKLAIQETQQPPKVAFNQE